VTPTPALVDRLGPAHAGEALTVQYAAYLSEGRRYGTTEIPPLVESLEELAADLARDDTRGFAAWIGPRLVGSVRLRRIEGPGPVEFTRYSVAPDVQGHGVGTALIDAAHATLAPGTVTVLVTGVRSTANLGLYGRRGYVETGREVDAAGVEVVRMERHAP
jgi:GNAT superfamily N-acetyltransferase